MQNTHAFNQDLSPWDIHQVIDFDGMFHSARAFRQDLCWSHLNDTQLEQIMEGTHGNLELMMDSRCLPHEVQVSENQLYIHLLWIPAFFLALCWFVIAYQLLRWLYCSLGPGIKQSRRSSRGSRRFKRFLEDEEEVLFCDEDATIAGNSTDDNHHDEEVSFEDAEQVAEVEMRSHSEVQRKSSLFPLHELTPINGDDDVSPDIRLLESNVSGLTAIVAGRNKGAEFSRDDLRLVV
jgi:Mycoplasma protein of unknown function, DUF285